jgi:hypothetical protein
MHFVLLDWLPTIAGLILFAGGSSFWARSWYFGQNLTFFGKMRFLGKAGGTRPSRGDKRQTPLCQDRFVSQHEEIVDG